MGHPVGNYTEHIMISNETVNTLNNTNQNPKDPASVSEALNFAVRCAVLAPSSHNSQPWQFKILDDSLMFILDRRRALPVVDPYDREMIISCGAALFNMRVALAYAGKQVRIAVRPDPVDEDLLARITLDGAALPAQDSALAALYPMISKRMTNRSVYVAMPIAPDVIAELEAAARAEWTTLSTATESKDREAIATLVAAADLAQFDDVRFRRELASWLHPARSSDGLAAFSGEMKKTLDFATPLAALVVRTFDVGNGVAAKDQALAAGSPLIACISTATDDAATWLAVGQSLQRVLLTAALHDLSASYLNQPIEVESFRNPLAHLMQTESFPQLLIRIGRGLPQTHSPRRELSEVIS
jgi:nitroreductase